METIVPTIKYLVEIGFSPLNLVLVGMMYFMGAHHGMFPKFWGDQDSQLKTPTIKDLHDQMSQLQGHFNHETTDRLDQINSKHDKLIEGVEELKLKHWEYEKYGIRVRKEAK